MSGPRAYLRSLSPGLPRSVWTLEAGFLVNAYGTGVAYPFLVIYLHNVRGLSLAMSGLVLATIGAASLVMSPLIGLAIDRVGGRRMLAASLVLVAAGYGLFPLVREPWHAFAVALLVGVGSGAFWPSQSTLLAGLAPQERRHTAYALQRGAYNLGIGLGGMTGGLIATTARPSSFTVLFLVNAAASLLFSTLLPLVPEPMRYEAAAGSGERRGGYLDVIRHRPFLGLVFLNFVFISVGQTQLELLPVFAKNEAGVNERQIGLIFLVSTLVLVVCQLPVAKLLEGRSRMRALALMPALWAIAWLVVEAGGAWFEAAAAALVFGLAAAVFGLGECLHGPTQGALVADLAPPLLRGRYLALSSSSWDLGYVAGPAIGGAVLAVAPLALWPLAAAICLAAAAGTLLLERVIPRELRLTPG